MIGTVLIVVTPWIAFGLSLATVCLRLRRFRRVADRPRNQVSYTTSDEDNRPAGLGRLFLQRGRR
jgi:hypothetical protein